MQLGNGLNKTTLSTHGQTLGLRYNLDHILGLECRSRLNLKPFMKGRYLTVSAFNSGELN